MVLAETFYIFTRKLCELCKPYWSDNSVFRDINLFRGVEGVLCRKGLSLAYIGWAWNNRSGALIGVPNSAPPEQKPPPEPNPWIRAKLTLQMLHCESLNPEEAPRGFSHWQNIIKLRRSCLETITLPVWCHMYFPASYNHLHFDILATSVSCRNMR